MRRRQSKLKMGLRGRSGLATYIVFGSAVLLALYYVWNNFLYTPPPKITYSSVQGLRAGNVAQWNRQKIQQDFLMEEPPIGLNKEIELQQMQNEQWKKAKALQDRMDEELLMEERAAKESNNREVSLEKTEASDKQNPKVAEEAGRRGVFQPARAGDGDYFSKLQRLVHLDLKGAPPLVSYLEKLFPLLKKLGATGLLLEYEDMFPYHGNISLLATKNAYTVEDLQRIHAAAKASDLEIIPLVQTFGHMEFVLKHGKYQHLRENSYTPQVITPVKEESYTLIFQILDQIVKAHPESQRVHLGCDEVHGLGQGQSNSLLVSQKMNRSQLFLQHVSKVAHHMQRNYPNVKPLIWDDWLRSIPFDQLATSGLPGVVEPVVWFYGRNILDRIPHSRWEIYGDLFPNVWVASAFKGATGSSQFLTNASFHLDNNLQWVDVIRTYGIEKKKVNFRGVVLTGWQRYDHFATLCELLPVGLPSLALNLQAVQSGGFGSREMQTAAKTLGCSNNLDLEFPTLSLVGAKVSQDCNFTGAMIFYSVQQLWGLMEVYKRDVGLQQRIVGWMTDYHVRRGISSPGQMKILAKKLHKLIDNLNGMVPPIREHLSHVYDKYTIDEWVEINLLDRVNKLKDLLNKAKRLMKRTTWPPRPFPEPTASSAVPAIEGKLLDQFQKQDNGMEETGYFAGFPQAKNRMGVSGKQVQGSLSNGVPQSVQVPVNQLNVGIQQGNVLQNLKNFGRMPQPTVFVGAPLARNMQMNGANVLSPLQKNANVLSSMQNGGNSPNSQKNGANMMSTLQKSGNFGNVGNVLNSLQNSGNVLGSLQNSGKMATSQLNRGNVLDAQANSRNVLNSLNKDGQFANMQGNRGNVLNSLNQNGNALRVQNNGNALNAQNNGNVLNNSNVLNSLQSGGSLQNLKDKSGAGPLGKALLGDTDSRRDSPKGPVKQNARNVLSDISSNQNPQSNAKFLQAGASQAPPKFVQMYPQHNLLKQNPQGPLNLLKNLDSLKQSGEQVDAQRNPLVSQKNIEPGVFQDEQMPEYEKKIQQGKLNLQQNDNAKGPEKDLEAENGDMQNIRGDDHEQHEKQAVEGENPQQDKARLSVRGNEIGHGEHFAFEQKQDKEVDADTGNVEDKRQDKRLAIDRLSPREENKEDKGQIFPPVRRNNILDTAKNEDNIHNSAKNGINIHDSAKNKDLQNLKTGQFPSALNAEKDRQGKILNSFGDDNGDENDDDKLPLRKAEVNEGDYNADDDV